MEKLSEAPKLNEEEVKMIKAFRKDWLYLKRLKDLYLFKNLSQVLSLFVANGKRCIKNGEFQISNKNEK